MYLTLIRQLLLRSLQSCTKNKKSSQNYRRLVLLGASPESNHEPTRKSSLFKTTKEEETTANEEPQTPPPAPVDETTMKVLVAVKRVVDYAVKVRVNKGTIDLANFKQSMNPFCEVSVDLCW
jgi:hypothetical protein